VCFRLEHGSRNRLGIRIILSSVLLAQVEVDDGSRIYSKNSSRGLAASGGGGRRRKKTRNNASGPHGGRATAGRRGWAPVRRPAWQDSGCLPAPRGVVRPSCAASPAVSGRGLRHCLDMENVSGERQGRALRRRCHARACACLTTAGARARARAAGCGFLWPDPRCSFQWWLLSHD